MLTGPFKDVGRGLLSGREAADLSRGLNWVERLSNFQANHGLRSYVGAPGVLGCLDLPPRLLAQVTGNVTNAAGRYAYSWVPAYVKSDGTLGTLSDDLCQGTTSVIPAYETNNALVTTGTYAELRNTNNEWMEFECPAAGTGSSSVTNLAVTNNETVGGTLVVTGQTTLNTTVVQGPLSLVYNSVALALSTYNDYAVGSYPKLSFTPALAATISGFTGGTTGRLLYLYNASSSFSITLLNNSGLSLAGNRILTPSTNSFVLYPLNGVILEYVGSAWVFDSPDVFRPSGGTATTGLVPRPSLTPGTTAFLREDGTWAAPSAAAALANGQAALSADSSNVSTTPAALSAPLTITLPTSGKTYKITATLVGTVTFTGAANGRLVAKLRDTTAGADVAGKTDGQPARATFCQAQVVSQAVVAGASVDVLYVAPANNTVVELYGSYAATGAMSAAKFLGNSSDGTTRLNWVQLD